MEDAAKMVQTVLDGLLLALVKNKTIYLRSIGTWSAVYVNTKTDAQTFLLSVSRKPPLEMMYAPSAEMIESMLKGYRFTKLPSGDRGRKVEDKIQIVKRFSGIR